MDIKDAFDEIERNAEERNKAAEGDYFVDGLLYCHKCNTPKQVKIDKYGICKVFDCLCRCASEDIEKKKEQKRQEEFLDRVKKLRKMGFPDSDLASCTFENDDMTNERISNMAHRFVDNFQTFKKSGKGLLLCGDVGSGKTYIAAAIANALIDKGHPCLVTNFPRLINTLGGMFEGKQEFIDGLNNFDLLVIDDLAAERNTEYMNETVQNIIDARYRAGLPLIVTTNLSVRELNNPSDIRKQRTYSRLMEMCFPVKVEHRDRRKEKASDDNADLAKILLGL